MTSTKNDTTDVDPMPVEEQIRMKFLSLLSETDDLDNTVSENIESLFETEMPSNPNQMIAALKLDESSSDESEADEAE